LLIIEASSQRTWKDLPDSSHTLLETSKPQPRYYCSISTLTASRPIRTETTHVEKVPAKGSESSGFFDLQSRSIPTGFP
jgi:hypothetical protein